MKYLNYIKNYKYIILFILIFIVIIFYIFLNLFDEEKVEENIVSVNEVKEEVEEKGDIINIKVDIKGAVKSPGVYELKSGSRVSDAINISGGLSSDADTSIINLSKLLKDEMVVIIYTKKEIQEMKKGTTTVKYIEKECFCPKLENNACIEDSITNNDVETNIDNEEKNKTTSKVSLNNATISELMTLSGIGESKAKAIIEYREKNNGFKTIEEIKNVSGIGNSTYEKIKDNLTI